MRHTKSAFSTSNDIYLITITYGLFAELLFSLICTVSATSAEFYHFYSKRIPYADAAHSGSHLLAPRRRGRSMIPRHFATLF